MGFQSVCKNNKVIRIYLKYLIHKSVKEVRTSHEGEGGYYSNMDDTHNYFNFIVVRLFNSFAFKHWIHERVHQGVPDWREPRNAHCSNEVKWELGHFLCEIQGRIYLVWIYVMVWMSLKPKYEPIFYSILRSIPGTDLSDFIFPQVASIPANESIVFNILNTLHVEKCWVWQKSKKQKLPPRICQKVKESIVSHSRCQTSKKDRLIVGIVKGIGRKDRFYIESIKILIFWRSYRVFQGTYFLMM